MHLNIENLGVYTWYLLGFLLGCLLGFIFEHWGLWALFVKIGLGFILGWGSLSNVYGSTVQYTLTSLFIQYILCTPSLLVCYVWMSAYYCKVFVIQWLCLLTLGACSYIFSLSLPCSHLRLLFKMADDFDQNTRKCTQKSDFLRCSCQIFNKRVGWILDQIK